MTVTYSLDISTASFLSIHRLLLRWKGSVWKAVLPELLLWLALYAVLSLVYRFALSGAQQMVFEDVAEFCYTYSSYIPITFMLGFYVQIVYTRWKDVFDNLGWVDSPGLLIMTAIKGTDEAARNIRRNILRYMVLVQALVFRNVSSNVKRRFPTMDHLVTAGLMTPNELREFDDIVSPQMKYWVPINWCFLLCRKARDLNMIDSDVIFVDVMDKIRMFRQNVLTLTLYDWVPVPLVYTQTVNLTVRSYFIICLMARQYLIHDRDTPNAKTIDMFFPVFTVLQFAFFIGWMKVAEVMLNPLGDDDDDFECNWILDRNLQVGLLMADSYGRLPKIERDMFWEDVLPEPLYTSESVRPHNYVGSCNDVHVQQQPQKRRLSEFLIPQRWRSEQAVDKATDEINILPAKATKFMATNTVSTEKLRYVEPNEVPVVRSNEHRRVSILDPETEVNDRNNKLMSSIVKKLTQQPGKRGLMHESSDTSLAFNKCENYVDGIPPPGQRRYSDISNLNPSDLNALMAQLAKTDDESSMGGSMSPLPGQSPQTANPPPLQTWTVNEVLPVIQEEEHFKSAFQSKASSAAPSRAQSRGNIHSDRSSFSNPPEAELIEDKRDLSPPIKDSFERLKTLLKNASFTSSDSSTTEARPEAPQTPRRVRSEYEYENFGFDDNWEEHSAPGNMEANTSPTLPPSGNTYLSRPRPRTNPRSRPEFRLSDGTGDSDNHSK